MPDPWASKPDSWDETEDGPWERPMIPKPAWRRFVSELWSSLLDACPWLLLGLLITGALSAAAPPEGAAMGYLGGSGFSAIVKGSAFGLLSPLCSCGALPIALGLVNAGAGTATAVAFMVAAQAAGIDSLMFTIGVLGFRCALARLFAAGLVATAAGFAVPGAFTASHDHHIHGKQIHGTFGERLASGMERAFIEGLDEVLLPLLFGFFLTALLAVLLPAGGLAISSALGGLAGRAVTLGFALPLQFCEHASVPLAVALQKAGASGGLAFAVLATVPAISTASAAVLWRVSGFAGAVRVVLAIWATGLALSFLADGLGAEMEQIGHSHEALPDLFVWVSQPVMGVLALASGIRTVRHHLQGHDHGCADTACKGCKAH